MRVTLFTFTVLSVYRHCFENVVIIWLNHSKPAQLQNTHFFWHCGSCVISTCKVWPLTVAVHCLCSWLRQNVPVALLSFPTRGESRMDVIFNVNVSTTKGERWSIDIQPEVRLSPVHHTLTLTLRPRSENHLAASLTSSSMHTHQRLNYSLRIFTQSCYSPTFCCSCFHTESRKLPDGFVLIFNGIYLRANRKYTGKHISDWNVLHPSYLTQITINTFLSSPRKHCTVYMWALAM